MALYGIDFKNIELLSEEKEIELGKKLREGGEEGLVARNELVSANLRLAAFYTEKYSFSENDYEDVFMAATEGLIHAAERFDYTRGCRFSTFASHWIKFYIIRSIINESRIIRIPVHLSELIYKLKIFRNLYILEFGEEPTTEQLSEYTGISEEKIIEADEAEEADKKMTSLEAECSDESSMTVEETISDDASNGPEETIERNELWNAITYVMNQITLRESVVLTLRHGLYSRKPMSLESIASLPEFGVSKQRIKQIETEAINKIRRSPYMMSMLRDFLR
ncbi:MAG: sigma-70 family RNA polymerase sigma factor [Eubacterium sp.]|nr:sigma-70 family RNA polymerase sigma factor [Eubacterium sp.]